MRATCVNVLFPLDSFAFCRATNSSIWKINLKMSLSFQSPVCLPISYEGGKKKLVSLYAQSCCPSRHLLSAPSLLASSLHPHPHISQLIICFFPFLELTFLLHCLSGFISFLGRGYSETVSHAPDLGSSGKEVPEAPSLPLSKILILFWMLLILKKLVPIQVSSSAESPLDE